MKRKQKKDVEYNFQGDESLLLKMNKYLDLPLREWVKIEKHYLR